MPIAHRLAKVELGSRNHVNCVRFGRNETIWHAMKKAEICYYLQQAGYSYICECKFMNKARADIYVIDDDTAIEICHSEEKKNMEKKIKRYPCNVVFMQSYDFLKNNKTKEVEE